MFGEIFEPIKSQKEDLLETKRILLATGKYDQPTPLEPNKTYGEIIEEELEAIEGVSFDLEEILTNE